MKGKIKGQWTYADILQSKSQVLILLETDQSFAADSCFVSSEPQALQDFSTESLLAELIRRKSGQLGNQIGKLQ